MTGAHPFRLVATTTLTVVAVVLSLYLLWLLRGPLSWIVLATFLAIVIAGPVTHLSRHMPRGLAIAVSYVGLLLIPVAVAGIVVPPIVREGASLIDTLPQYAADFEAWVQSNEQLRSLDEDFDITGRLEELARELPGRVGDAATWLGDLGLGVVNSAFAAVTIILLSIFIVANGRRWVDMALSLQPPERASKLRPTINAMGEAVGSYVAGALLQAGIAGVLTFIVLTILGVPFAGPLAVVVALFDLIPMVGATIAAVVVGVITVFADFPQDTVIWTIWSLVYQQIENNIIQPRIQQQAVGVHPFVVIVSVLFGSTLFGVGGALLAVPVAASLQIVVRDWWRLRAADRAGVAAVNPERDNRPHARAKGAPAMATADSPARVLVVANRTAATPALIAAVRERAAQGPARFTLLVPNTVHGLDRITDPEDAGHSEADHVLELAIPLLEEAAGGPVEGVIGVPEPLAAIQDAINLRGYDEIILSTLPRRVSRWLRLDLPHKVAGLGLPVTTITAQGRDDVTAPLGS